MASVTIYDSEGYTYSNRQSEAEGDSRIQNFFFAGVRLSLDLSHGAEIIAFFRARESRTGRTEQYYAQYQTQTFNQRTLREFKQAVEERAADLGLTITTSSQDVQVFRELDTESGSPPGEQFDRTIINQLLEQRRRVNVGVNSYTDALALLSSLTSSNARTIAIVDDAQQDVLADYDLTIEQGNYRGIEPIGQTQSHFDEAQENHEDQYINEKLNTIKAEVADIQQNTSIGADELEGRLKTAIPVLSASSSRSTSSTTTSSLGQRSSRLGSQSLSARLLESIPTRKLVLLFFILLIALGSTGLLYFTVFGGELSALLPSGGGETAGAAPTTNATTTTQTATTSETHPNIDMRISTHDSARTAYDSNPAVS